jgi:MFS family permease
MDSTTTPTGAGFYINPNFAKLWIGQAVSILGDFVFDITLILWVATDLAAGKSWAPLAVSGVLLAATIPIVVLGPLAGVFVDRWDKRRTMLAMDILRASLIGLLMLFVQVAPHLFAAQATRHVELVAVYVVVFLASTCAQFFNPSRLALIGDVVAPDLRNKASGMGQTTTYLAGIVGPPLAGPLFFHAGARSALLINGLSFLVSFVAILLVEPPVIALENVAKSAPSVFREFREGIAFFGHNRVLMTLLVSLVIVMFGAGALNALDVFFVTVNLHTSASLFGVLSAAIGSGAVLGAIAASTLGSRIPAARIFWISLLLTSVGLLIYSRMTSFWPAVVALFVTGIPMAALNVAIMPLILGVTPRDMLGRVTSVLMPVVNVATLGSIVLAGWLAGTVMIHFKAHAFGLTFGPVDSIFLAAGILGLVSGMYAMLGLRGTHAATPMTTSEPQEDVAATA